MMRLGLIVVLLVPFAARGADPYDQSDIPLEQKPDDSKLVESAISGVRAIRATAVSGT